MKLKLCVVGVVLFLCSSCTLNSQFVDAVDGAWTMIGPEYVKYVQDDTTLSPDTKVIRTRTALLLTETIAEAQK